MKKAKITRMLDGEYRLGPGEMAMFGCKAYVIDKKKVVRAKMSRGNCLIPMAAYEEEIQVAGGRLTPQAVMIGFRHYLQWQNSQADKIRRRFDEKFRIYRIVRQDLTFIDCPGENRIIAYAYVGFMATKD